jgi:hypothetical protein
MNVNVWGVTHATQHRNGDHVSVDDRLLSDPDVPLDELVTERGVVG